MNAPHPAETPETLQLIRLVKTALLAGGEDAGAPLLSPARLQDGNSKGVIPSQVRAITGLIVAHQQAPAHAVINAYFYARSQAAADPAWLPSPQPPARSLLQTALNAWLQERNKKPPAARPGREAERDPEYFQPNRLIPLVQQALTAGYRAETPAVILTPESLHKSTALLLSKHPYDPHWAVIKAYFGGRGQALANHLDRSPMEEPERWLRQAAANWLRENGVAAEQSPGNPA